MNRIFTSKHRGSPRHPRSLPTLLIALFLGAFVSTAASTVADELEGVLTERRPLNPVVIRAEPVSEKFSGLIDGSPYRLIVKFHDPVRARSQRGSIISETATELAGTRRLARSFGMSFSPLIRLPEEALQELERRAASRSGVAQPDLAGLMVVVLHGADPTELEAAGRALQALPEVEFAYIQTLLQPPPGDIDPPTPDHVALQSYRGPDPGLDVDYAWSQGWTGQGVRLSDCEFAWRYDHEDLMDKDLHPEPGKTIHPWVQQEWFEHGTATLGVTSAVVNGYGVSGMAPDAEVHTFPEWASQGGMRRVDAITQAIAGSQAGDVVLLEMQKGGGPAELDPAVWTVVKTGTDAGVVVVGAAGNGGRNLDDEEDAEITEYRERGDSGAILVGAGSPDTQHDRLSFSTYGSRVDVQGWGGSVATLGFGDLAAYGGDKNQRYTASFNGTSSASAMVAAAAVLLQEASGKTLTPTELRQLLIDTGVPQGSGGHIGPFVDLRAALEQLNEPPTAQFTYSCSRLQCTFDANASSDVDGTIVHYEWTFPGGAKASGATTSFFMPRYGYNRVTLEVTDDDGATGSRRRNIYTGVQPTITPRYGLWYNPDRSGNSIELYRNGAGDHFLVWYTYEEDGTPTWYISDTGPKVRSTWTEPLFKATWNGTSADLAVVGAVRLVFSDPDNAWFSWVLDDKAGGEHFRFLTGGAARTGSWYAPAESGWGIQIAEQAGVMTTSLTFYVDGQPRWVQGQGVAGEDVSISVRWFTGIGLCPSCSGGSTTPPPSQPAGTVQLQIPYWSSTGTATTLIVVPGGTWYRLGVPILRLAGAL